MASQKYIASTKWPSFQVWKTGDLESNPRFMPDFFQGKFQVKQTKTLLQHWCSRLFRLKNGHFSQHKNTWKATDAIGVEA